MEATEGTQPFLGNSPRVDEGSTMYRRPKWVPPGRRRPAAVYFFLGAAAFCLMWIVIVLKDGELGIGPSHNAVHYTPKDDPLVYWGTVLAVVGVLVTMIVLTIRAERDHRERQKLLDELEDESGA